MSRRPTERRAAAAYTLGTLYAQEQRYADAARLSKQAFHFAEFFREPDAFIGFLALGFTMGQWLCLAMIAGGATPSSLGAATDPGLPVSVSQVSA